MKLLESTENEITKHKNCKDVPHLEITEAILVDCNIVKNDYQQCSNKSFGNLLEISPTSYTLLKTFDSDFLYIEVWFTDESSPSLERKYRVR